MKTKNLKNPKEIILTEAEIIEEVDRRDFEFKRTNRTFLKNDLIDKILIELIDGYRRLRYLKTIPDDIHEFENSWIEKQYFENKFERELLTERVNFLSGLMTS